MKHMQVEWVANDPNKPNVAIINGGSKYRFVGVIRGLGFPQITYFADSVEEILDGLELDEWIYSIREVN